MLYQIPIDFTLAGVYSWTQKLSDQTVTGTVVVLGSEAGPIGNWPYEAGTETWYYDKTVSAQNSPQQLVLKLETMKPPTSAELIAVVGEIRETQTQIGVSEIAPSWVEGDVVPEGTPVFTMEKVLEGEGDFDPLYYNVSMIMPVDGEPLMPTFNTSIPDLPSIFGDNPVTVGITAQFTQVAKGEDGYPTEGWFWTGRDPAT